MRTRAKICGITRQRDADWATRCGADAIGLVFYPRSPRAVTVEQARAVVRDLPAFVTVVGLFVNAERTAIADVLKVVRIDLLQFHGDEPPGACVGHGRPYIKALRMRDGLDLVAEARRYPDARGLLLDTYSPRLPGGTGTVFDWQRIPPELAPRVILAGGLTPENVEEAIRSVRPYAVDVSGGVEQSKGIKDPDKIAAFMRGVIRADR
jgi:phosphoribosylanthranilate isomerase